MIRRFVILLSLAVLVSLGAGTRANAQGVGDRVEIYGGYSYFHLDNAPGTSNLNGWILSGQYKFSSWLGATGEFSGDYGGSQSVHTFLFGPQVSFPARISPFAHVLIGGAHYSAPGFGDTSFAAELGGGFDAKIAPALSWRIFEGDYVLTRFGNTTENNAKFSTGIVFRF
ncbi:MAG: hypothetical protein WAN14_04190 [Candidatus Acidiferrales bacterium]